MAKQIAIYVCGAIETHGGWCTNKSCSEYKRYENQCTECGDPYEPISNNDIRCKAYYNHQTPQE